MMQTLIIEHVLDEMIEIAKRSDSTAMKSPITTDDVTCVTSLTNNKAPGWDYITVEHIKCGGHTFVDALAYLFNVIVRRVHIQIHQKVGVIVRIPKADKDIIIHVHSTGSTLLPIIDPIFVMILLAHGQSEMIPWIHFKVHLSANIAVFTHRFF